MVKKYHLSKHPKDYKVSEHFTLREFASPVMKNGEPTAELVDLVYIDTTMLKVLEKVRAKFGGETKINCGLRTKAYNAYLHGANNSAHMTGKADDFRQYDKNKKLVKPIDVCIFLEKELKWKYGIGMMKNSTHVDCRFRGNHMDETRKDATSSNGYYTLNKHAITFEEYKKRRGL